MDFSDGDLSIIKFFRVEKGYGARKIITECLTKQWSRSAVEKLLRKIDRTGSVQRQLGSGRPRSARCVETVHAVEELVLIRCSHMVTFAC